jgi:hypothetical protein
VDGSWEGVSGNFRALGLAAGCGCGSFRSAMSGLFL